MTRILNNPADYIPDQNHHAHLANGTINNDWMYVYELAMNQKINKLVDRLRRLIVCEDTNGSNESEDK